jgi:hypothetical protein
VDDLQRDELVVRGVDAADKVKTRCDTTVKQSLLVGPTDSALHIKTDPSNSTRGKERGNKTMQN